MCPGSGLGRPPNVCRKAYLYEEVNIKWGQRHARSFMRKVRVNSVWPNKILSFTYLGVLCGRPATESLPHPSCSSHWTASPLSWGDAGHLRVGTGSGCQEGGYPGIRDSVWGRPWGWLLLTSCPALRRWQCWFSPSWWENCRQNNLRLISELEKLPAYTERLLTNRYCCVFFKLQHFLLLFKLHL